MMLPIRFHYAEVGDKIDYSEYGDLLNLYKLNFQKFMEYNIHDAVLVEKLEEKLGDLEDLDVT